MNELKLVLEKASNDRLKDFSDIMTKQWNELLSDTKEYKEGYPNNLTLAIPQMAWMFLLYGGYDIANIFRGLEGPSLHTVECKVARKLKVTFDPKSSCEDIEKCILNTILERSFNNMSEEELKKLLDEMEIHNYGFKKQTMIAALLYAFRAGGFFSYQLLVIITNYICRAILGRGLTLGANAALTRLTNLYLGPVGATMIVLLTIKDFTAPAYRVIIPGVILIALMREEQKYLTNNALVA